MKQFFKQRQQHADYSKREMVEIIRFQKETSRKFQCGMNTIFTICFFLFALSTSVNAQTKFGLQVGTNCDFENNEIGNYNFGGFINVPLSTHWMVEPSLNIFPFGSETTTTESKTTSFYSNAYKKTIYNTANTITNTKNDAMSINVPVLFAYRFSLSDMFGLQLGVGPYLNCLFSGTSTVNKKTTTHYSFDGSTHTQTDETKIDTDNELSYGGMLRVGFLINNFSVNIDYTGYDSVSEDAFESKSFMLRLGYQF